MSKRFVAVPLWFLTGWLFGALAAFALGWPSWLPVLTALSFGVVVAVDPAGWFWARPAAAAPPGSESVPSGLKA